MSPSPIPLQSKERQLTLRRKVACAAATIIGSAALTTALAAPALATIIGRDDGFGATAAQAQFNATVQLHDDYYGCGPVFLISDVQQSDGTWYAQVTAACEYPI
jgi:hypothetical protein